MPVPRFFPPLLAAIAVALPAAASAVCPFCSAPTLTLTEQATQSDAVLLATWKSASKGQGELTDAGGNRAAASTTFTVTRVMKGPLKAGQTVRLVGYQPAEPGAAFLLTGIGSGVIEWDLPAEFDAAAFDYLAASPPPVKAGGEKVPARDRLPYFVKFLEYPDDTIANDAYGEFANAAYEEIAAAKAVFPRAKLREWVTAPDTAPSRLGLYGLLLGLCGGPDDAAAVEQLVMSPTEDFRIGLDGVMSGYLLLTGPDGLERLRKTKLEAEQLTDAAGKPVLGADGQPVPVPFSETYAAMQAVRFMWSFGGDAIPKDQLKAAMRTLLARPELIDFAVADLARWKDWTVIDRLAKLYDDPAYGTPGIKQSIIRYLLAASKDTSDGTAKPEHVAKAERYLAAIEKSDPEAVARVKQFLILVE